MKKIFYITALLLSVISIGLISCDKDNSDPDLDPVNKESTIKFSEYGILEMSFINANEGWLFVSVNGGYQEYKLLHSTDGFQNYSIVSETCPRFRKIKFIDSNNGIGISWDGADRNFYTTDGGVTWQNFIGDGDGDITYNSTYFVMPYTYEESDFLMRIGACFYNKSDFQFHHKTTFSTPKAELFGGSSGSDQHYSSVHLSENGALSFTGVYMQDDVIFDVNSSFTAYCSNETTLSTSLLANTKKSPERTEFPTDEVGYFSLADDSNLYKTIDKGETWNAVYTFDDPGSYIKISFADENNGAVLNGTQLFLTNDGGQTFHESAVIDEDYDVAGEIDYVDRNNIYLSVLSLTGGSYFEQLLIKIGD
ncbi:hypothetical protein [Ancylomarina sp. 16SWW S1-10-2]|uniref:WD40/YVTN/BNR-like repeat-containing protein n=1 Tax=Ancylomarina sp. 16SWW S1-10-2 TaxID=2499681 RepID=UPI0012AE5B82|nr:hypothetical protein [Ancylomarina sp. 16SWW S1-10-2]MRT93140.1 hypothetical protein [Ancylomarina sp. 16SWW S1-10-2]